jgi:hypothetical protein
MEELLAVAASANRKPIPKTVKRKPISKTPSITFEKKDVVIYLTDHPKPTEYMGYLIDELNGYFYNKDDPVNDYFHRCLVSLKTQQIELINNMDEVRYITPFNSQGFKFKPAKKVLYCYDQKRGTPIDYTKCINKLCKFRTQIRPYDFVKDDTRIAGLSIKVIGISLV